MYKLAISPPNALLLGLLWALTMVLVYGVVLHFAVCP